MSKKETSLPRRKFISNTAILGAAVFAPPFIKSVRAADSLKVGTYGGYFEESFVKYIFPEFTKETGIEIESIPEPTGSTWLIQLKNAAKAGVAPADVSMMAGVPRLRGAAQKLWAPLDENKLSNLKYLSEDFIGRYDDGSIYGVAGVSWYITLCQNTDVLPEVVTSWADMWDPKYEDQLGLLALAENSYLLEITATTFFDGPETLQTQEGITKVSAKLSELGSNVRLWYKDEGSFQQALQDGEIPIGQYYHDVTGLAAADGFPVISTFPKEGGVVDSGYWLVSTASKMQEQAHVFIDYICRPTTQALLSRNVGTAPVVRRESTDLTDEEFGAVSSDIPPIIPQYEIYMKRGEWISESWNEMISA